MGYAFAIKKPIIGVRTDFRNSEDRGVNLMVSHACSDYIVFPETDIQLDLIVDIVIGSILAQK